MTRVNSTPAAAYRVQHAELDSLAAETVVGALGRVFPSVVPAGRTRRAVDGPAGCEAMLSRIRRSDTTGVAALLAGACVAPVVLQVVLFSSDLYAKGTVLALGLPFVLGIGMAVPWPLAGAGMTALPKPGAWMVRVKQVFG